jgi:hypothetical protein
LVVRSMTQIRAPLCCKALPGVAALAALTSFGAGAVNHPGMGYFSANPSGQALRSVTGLPFYDGRANVNFLFSPA